MKRLSLAVLLAILGTGLGAANASNPLDVWPLCVPRTSPVKLGATEVASTKVDSRIEDVTLASRAMQINVHVDVMVPSGYGSSPGTRYPVLYLLHGALANYTSWADNGVEGIIGAIPMIVVMPDDGPTGSYSDWYGDEVGFPGPVPAWESFHVDELVPWVDAHYRTIASPSARYIAGLSSGGGGAMKYASANPGLFAAAGEFSGAVDPDLPGNYGVSDVTFDLSYGPSYGPPAHCTWGDPNSEQVIWEDNDPTYEAANLGGTRLFLASGNGQPGPYDARLSTPDVVEGSVWSMNQAFAASLDVAHVAYTKNFYGPGTHSWPYWQRDLRWFLAWLHPVPPEHLQPPAGFSMRSARSVFRAWGWTFSPARSVREFTYLSGVGPDGLTAVGSGTLAVLTAPLYVPSVAYKVSGHRTTADLDGRLRFTVDLGPSHTVQQTTFGAGPPTGWEHVTVSIRRVS